MTDDLRAKFEVWYPNAIGDVQPFDCYAQGHASRDAEVEALRHNLSASISKADRLAAILTSIHSLLYPPEMNVGGRKYVFNPPADDANAWMRELSDRIREIPRTLDTAMREESK